MVEYWYDHVHIVSHDPQATARWFADKLGATVKSPWVAPNGVVHIIVDLKGANILVKGRPDEPDAKSTSQGNAYGLEHFGILTNDLDAAVADLKAKGVLFVQDIVRMRPGARNAFFNGPENILMEVIERKPV